MTQDDERRDAIAAAAARCFQRWGVGKTRMEDVAREAGIARPGLYRYYGGKDALLHEVILRHIRQRSVVLHQRLPTKGRAGPLLVEAVLSGIFGPRDDEGLTAAILDVDTLHDTARLIADSEAIAEAMAAHWRPYLEHAQQRSELRPGVDLQQASRWLTLIVFTFLTVPELTPADEDLAEYVRTFVVGALV